MEEVCKMEVTSTARKGFVFGVILVLIFAYWTEYGETQSKFLYSATMRENYGSEKL